MSFMDSAPTQTEALVVENAADHIPGASRKRTRRFVNVDFEGVNIILVP